MKKIIFGQFFKLLILASSISLLAACGASDAIDAANAIDDINNDLNTGEVLGSVTVSGNDTQSFGTGFQPTTDLSEFAVVGDVIVAVFVDVDVSIDLFVLDGSAKGLTVSFSSVTGLPITVGYSVSTDQSQDFSYVANCDEGADCTGVSINLGASTVTFTDAVLLDNEDELDNVATGSVTLNGSVRYILQ